MFKILLFSLFTLSRALPITVMYGNFEKCFSEKCVGVNRVDIVENECTKRSNELTVSFFLNNKKYYGILDKDYKIKETKCTFSDEGSDEEIYIFKDGLKGFFNDSYDLVYGIYAAIIQFILGVIGFKKIKQFRDAKEGKETNEKEEKKNKVKKKLMNKRKKKIQVKK